MNLPGQRVGMSVFQIIAALATWKNKEYIFQHGQKNKIHLIGSISDTALEQLAYIEISNIP